MMQKEVKRVKREFKERDFLTESLREAAKTRKLDGGGTRRGRWKWQNAGGT